MAAKGSTQDECRHCGARLREASSPRYSSPAVERFRLWCHECGTLNVVRSWVENRGDGEGGGFFRMDEPVEHLVPRLAAAARLEAPQGEGLQQGNPGA